MTSTNVSPRERSAYWDNVKFLLISLVVLGHCLWAFRSRPGVSLIVGSIYLFHMPLFLFVSGYLSKNAEKRRSKAFEDLFIPYAVFQLFVGVCMLVLTKSGGALQNIFAPQMGAWYLLTLFSFRIVLPETRRIKGILFLGAFETFLFF